MCTLQFYFGKLATGYYSIWAHQKASSPHPQESLLCHFSTNTDMLPKLNHKLFSFETTFSIPLLHHISISGSTSRINKQTCDYNHTHSLTSMQ